MTITLNGQEKIFDDTMTLQDIITQSLPSSTRVVAEVNGVIIKSMFWEQTFIKDGDTVELVSFVGGG